MAYSFVLNIPLIIRNCALIIKKKKSEIRSKDHCIWINLYSPIVSLTHTKWTGKKIHWKFSLKDLTKIYKRTRNLNVLSKGWFCIFWNYCAIDRKIETNFDQKGNYHIAVIVEMKTKENYQISTKAFKVNAGMLIELSS